MGFILAFCDKSYEVTIMLIVKMIFTIACYLIPIIVIIATIINLFKPITSGKDEELKDNFKIGVRRIIAGLVVMMIPTVLSYVFNNFTNGDKVDFLTCFNTASKERIEALKAKEEAEEEARQRQQEAEDERTLRAAYEADQKNRDKNKQTFEEWKKEREEKERQQQQQQQQSGGTSSANGSIIANVTPGTSNIIIGDSRTVGMCASLTGDWTNCQFAKGHGKTNGSDLFIAEGSMGYSWFNSTAVPAVNSVLASNPNTKYNIYSLMGVNFLLSDIDKYIPLYNSLASGQWKNHKIILVSVTPVNEAIEAQKGYSTKNSSIETFNAKLKNGVRASNVSYCDVYNQIKGNFQTGDGLHYYGETYKNIYNLMKQC